MNHLDMNANTGRIARRTALGLGLSAGFLAGCSFFETDPDGGGATGPDAGGPRPKEAPTLAQLVEAGELPPLEERLPRNPLVVQPNDRLGTYGGTWTSALLGTADWPWLSRTVGYEALMRWNIDWTEVVPNVAENLEINDDATEFRITLREGMKWSDGEPFTADDIVFAYESVHNNRELYPSLSPLLQTEGEPMRIVKEDDTHFSFVFQHSHGTFVQRTLAMKQGRQDMWCCYPRHYFEQFHGEFNENAQAEAEEAGFATWAEWFLAKATFWENHEIPLLHPWIASNDFGDGQRLSFERNPYYFKTDPEGSQLPYIDSVSMEIIADAEVILLKVANGEFNFHTRHVMTPANRPVIADGREDGEYEFVSLRNTLMNELIVSLNLNHPDERLRGIFQNKDFRIGLSHGINREEINTAVFQSQGFIQQAAPVPDSEFWDEEMATQYTEFDQDLANEYLDRAGLSQRNSSGMRIDESGQTVSFIVNTTTGNYPWHTPGAELIVQHWRDLGVDARQETVDRGLLGTLISANEQDATVFVGAGGYGEEMLEPRFVFPYSVNSEFATRWAQWFTSEGAAGEEPPEATKEQMRLFRQLERTPELEDQKRIFREILQIAKEEFYTIGTLSVASTYAVVANDFHNVPEEIIESDRYNAPGPTNPEQYFIEG